MAIYKGDTPTVLYKGDHHPAALYKGETMLAGWNETAVSGDAEITGTYNDTAMLWLTGMSRQEGVPSPEKPSPVLPAGGVIRSEGQREGQAGAVEPPALYAIEVDASYPYNHTTTDDDGMAHYWVADTLKEDTLTRRVGVKVFDGTENLTRSDNTSASSFCVLVSMPDAKTGSKYGYFSHGKVGSLESIAQWDNAFIYNINMYQFLRLSISCFPDWSDSDTDTVKLQKFKAYLAAQYAAGTPVTVYYLLDQPIVETIVLPALPTFAKYSRLWRDTPVEKLPYTITATVKVVGEGVVRQDE